MLCAETKHGLSVQHPRRLRVSVCVRHTARVDETYTIGARPKKPPFLSLYYELVTNAPTQPSYVLASASASTLLAFYHGFMTGHFRRLAAVPYPNAYAPHEEAEKSVAKYRFNCAQRAHANFDDAHPSLLVNLLVAGLAFPEVAAGMGLVWTLGRLFYLLGYTREKVDKGRGRYNGVWWLLPHMALFPMAGWSVYKIVFG